MATFTIVISYDDQITVCDGRLKRSTLTFRSVDVDVYVKGSASKIFARVCEVVNEEAEKRGLKVDAIKTVYKPHLNQSHNSGLISSDGLSLKKRLF